MYALLSNAESPHTTRVQDVVVANVLEGVWYAHTLPDTTVTTSRGALRRVLEAWGYGEVQVEGVFRGGGGLFGGVA